MKRKGLTIKNPTNSQCVAIKAAGLPLGIRVEIDKLSKDYPWVWFWEDDKISTCVSNGHTDKTYVTFGEFMDAMVSESPIITIDGVEYSESTLRSLIKKATT